MYSEHLFKMLSSGEVVGVMVGDALIRDPKTGQIVQTTSIQEPQPEPHTETATGATIAGSIALVAVLTVLVVSLTLWWKRSTKQTKDQQEDIVYDKMEKVEDQ